MLDEDRDCERGRIEELALRYQEKWTNDQAALPPGYQRRSALSWFAIANKLAMVQAAYDECLDQYPDHLLLRALMAVWPAVMPYDGEHFRKLTRRQREILRERLTPVLHALFMMAEKRGHASSGFDIPIITIRHRKSSERHRKALQEDLASSGGRTAEIIGRAVVQEYRRHPPGRRSLDSAFLAVAEVQSIDGVQTNSPRSVEARYHAYRRMAFDRGFADSRAVWCQYYGDTWPSDQVWLADFPPS